ncbi:hypothetical protein ACR0ST_07850 [Aliidiomarina sp. Khilg15.8]
MRPLTLLFSAVAATMATTASIAQVDPFGLRPEIDLSVDVLSSCTLSVDPDHPAVNPMNLDLSPNSSWQHVAEISIACNTSQTHALVTYYSVNGGLKSSGDYLIDYRMDITGSGSQGRRLASQGIMPINQRVGPHKSFLRLEPQTTGREPAGDYSDIIEITVTQS